MFIAHGRQDPVMEVGFARRASDLLEAGGLDVEYHESDAGHHIDPAHVPAAVDWLRTTLLSGSRRRSGSELEARRDSIRGRVDTLAERPSSAPRRASASASATAPRRRSAAD